MKLSDDGNFILLGEYTYDPFIKPEEWKQIVAQAKEQFPGVDYILFKCPMYLGLASISETLDFMGLTQEMMARGVFVMGSNKKVNIMTNSQMGELVQLIQDNDMLT